jgi:DNA-binding NarL/FixJ family response regulator
MLFEPVSDEQLADLNRYLLNKVPETLLIDTIKKVGLTEIEEQITILRYGKARKSVDDVCSELNISMSTYKRHRRNILYKISLYFEHNSKQ